MVVSAAKFDIQRLLIPPLLWCAIARIVRSRRGTAFSVDVGVPKSTISIKGQLKTFHDTGDSGQPVERNFCPECGSPIFSDVAVMPELSFIKAHTLDDTSWLDPKMHVYCDSKAALDPDT